MNTKRAIIVRGIMKLLPETSCFGLKRLLWRWAGAKVGHNVRICSSAFILGAGELEIGDDTWIGHQVMLIASSRISIGARVDIGPRVYIGTGTHKLQFKGKRCAGENISINILIEDGCWLGANVTILPGVKIQKMTMVAAGAVVTSSFSGYSLLAGIPAVLKHIN